MANVFAVKSGNWSDPTVWNTGALPTSDDNVYSNTFTVTIDISPTVLSIRNSAVTGPPTIVAGGGFTIATPGVTLTANVIATSGVCLTISHTSGTVTVNGSSTGSATVAFAHGISFTGAGILNVNGDCTGNVQDARGLLSSSSGTVTVTGNVFGSDGGNAHGVQNSSTGTMNIIGNITGATFGNVTAGAVNSGSGTMTVTATGSITGIVGPGLQNTGSGTVNIIGVCSSAGAQAGVVNSSSTGTINITGTCTGGTSTGAAFVNSSSGLITHIGVAQSSTTAPAISFGSVSQRTILTGPLISTDENFAGGATASGINPCIAARWFPKDTALSTFSYTMRGENVEGSIRPDRSLYLIEAYETTYPSESDVRLGTTYAPEDLYTGSCAVPGSSSVLVGVPVDDTVGDYVASAADFWNVSTELIGTSGSIGERMKNAATIQSVGAQIEALGA